MKRPVYEQLLSTLKKAVNENPRPPELMRQLAREVVALRQQFTFDGLPDWAGQSQEYRDTIYRAYREAGVPSDSKGGLQPNIRYHVGNAVRDVASTDDLAALDMRPEGPRARAVTARRKPALNARPSISEPEPGGEMLVAGTQPAAIDVEATGERVAELQVENLRLRRRIEQLESTLDVLLERMTKASDHQQHIQPGLLLKLPHSSGPS